MNISLAFVGDRELYSLSFSLFFSLILQLVTDNTWIFENRSKQARYHFCLLRFRAGALKQIIYRCSFTVPFQQ